MRAVPTFEGGLQSLVQLGKRSRSRIQWLVLDHAQLRDEPVDGAFVGVVGTRRAHAATLPDRVTYTRLAFSGSTSSFEQLTGILFVARSGEC